MSREREREREKEICSTIIAFFNFLAELFDPSLLSEFSLV
jgi:hypothetical protein